MSDYLKFDETGTIVTGYKGYPENVSIPDGVIEIIEIIEIKGSAFFVVVVISLQQIYLTV